MDRTFSVKSAGYDLVVEEFGKGPFVIYAHGLGSNRHDTHLQWESVAEYYRVIVFDQRGHGDSSPVIHPDDYNPQAMGEDITAIMDAMDIPKAIVGGVSMGACTSLAFAMAHPERVVKLLQTGPAVGDHLRAGLQDLTTTGDLLEQKGVEGAIADITRQWHSLEMPLEAIDEMKRRYRGYHRDSMAAAYHAVPSWVVDFSLLGMLKLPVYILAWENDPVHDIAIARKMTHYLPNAKLEVIPGVFTPNIGEIYQKLI